MTDKWVSIPVSECDELRAEIKRLRAVVEAARAIALRDSPTHQRLREALEALATDHND